MNSKSRTHYAHSCWLTYHTAIVIRWHILYEFARTIVPDLKSVVFSPRTCKDLVTRTRHIYWLDIKCISTDVRSKDLSNKKKNNINPLSPNNRAHYHISLNNSWGWLVLFSHQKEAIIWGKAIIEGRRLFQILPSKGAIIWGRRIIEGQLLFKEIR